MAPSPPLSPPPSLPSSRSFLFLLLLAFASPSSARTTPMLRRMRHSTISGFGFGAGCFLRRTAAARRRTSFVRGLAAGAHGEIKAGLEGVRERMMRVSEEAGVAVELIAVSKTKPVEMLQEAYAAGQRVFGENYAQEMVEKAPQMPPDTQWHFIGKLQTNKVNGIVKGVPNLKAVHTVHSEKLARKLGTACEAVDRGKLDIYLQVDTSGEASKNGVSAGPELNRLAKVVASLDPPFDRLNLKGLMTIGAPNDTSCFDKLVEARAQVAESIGVEASSLKLSMGMSGDFEEAIRHGSNMIRVGSTIFGARDYSKK